MIYEIENLGKIAACIDLIVKDYRYRIVSVADYCRIVFPAEQFFKGNIHNGTLFVFYGEFFTVFHLENFVGSVDFDFFESIEPCISCGELYTPYLSVGMTYIHKDGDVISLFSDREVVKPDLFKKVSE